MHTAKLGDRVRINYSRLPQHGAATDKPLRHRVLEFTAGSKDLIPSVSLGVVGMALGDKKRLQLQPDEAYGTRQKGLIKEIPRRRFPKHLILRLGKRLTAVNTVSGTRRRVRIVQIKPDSVVVDGNHLLAGKVVQLEITLISLDSSSNANKRKPQFDLGGEG
jgi:FKBP-type peptidyl-prolyl cis-trans isomerases 2